MARSLTRRELTLLIGGLIVVIGFIVAIVAATSMSSAISTVRHWNRKATSNSDNSTAAITIASVRNDPASAAALRRGWWVRPR